MKNKKTVEPKKKKGMVRHLDSRYEDKGDYMLSSSEGDLGYAHVIGNAGSSAMMCEDSGDNHLEIHKYMESYMNFLEREGYEINPRPAIELDETVQDGIDIRTGYYDPGQKKVVVFVYKRALKDIMRSFAHEMVHHMQNLHNENMDWGRGGDLKDDKVLWMLEGEAYHVGNVLFRMWTEELKKTKELNESKKRKKQVKNDKGELVPETCDKCGGKVVCQIHGEPVYICKDCGKYFGTMPCSLNESVIKESPDYVDGFSLSWHDANAIPFMIFAEDGEFYVGNPGQSHPQMFREMGVDSELLSRMSDEVFESLVVMEGSGRYWPQKNVISFWSTPVDDKKMLRDVVNQLASRISIDVKNLLVDYWDCPKDKLMPYRWFINGTFDMLQQIGVLDVYPENEYEYGSSGKYTNFIIRTNEYKTHTLDIDGNFVQNVYQASPVYESFDVKKALKNLKKRRDPANIENWDSLDEATESDVDLSSFKVKNELNPKIWVKGLMDSRVRLKLLDIAQDFIEFLDVNWVDPEDTIVVGSIANYNWSEYSDIDLHIVMDYSKVDDRKKFVENYFQSKKREWNDTHDKIRIFGFPVELYVQDKDANTASGGIYSLDKNKWIKEPKKGDLDDKNINHDSVKKKAADFMTDIENLGDEGKKADGDTHDNEKVYDKSEKLITNITSTRKNSLSSTKDEMNTDNIVFKVLRRNGYLDKLFKLRDRSYDKMNSLN